MKQLIVYPYSIFANDKIFYLIDPETGECFASHLCSSKYYALNDLYFNRPKLIEKLNKKYNTKEISVKFLDETNYSLDDIKEKNKQFYKCQ